MSHRQSVHQGRAFTPDNFAGLRFPALRTPGTKVSDLNMCRQLNPVPGWAMLAGESPTTNTVAGMAPVVGSLPIYFRQQPAKTSVRKI